MSPVPVASAVVLAAGSVDGVVSVSVVDQMGGKAAVPGPKVMVCPEPLG